MSGPQDPVPRTDGAPVAHWETRAGDADREVVARQIGDALSEGRLQIEEYHSRLDAAYAARTLGDLALLVDDRPTTSAPEDERPMRRRRWLRCGW